MKILLAIHHFPPRYSAGAELYTYRLARWLQVNGHQVEVVCIEESGSSSSSMLNAQLDHYHDVPVWRLNLDLTRIPYHWEYNHPQIGTWLDSHIRRSQPDLVHLHSGYLLGANVVEVAHNQGIATAITLHDYWFLCPRITLLRGDGSLCAKVPADPAVCAWCLRLDKRRNRLADQVSGGAAGYLWRRFAPLTTRDEIAARRAYLKHVLGLADLVLAPTHFLAGLFSEMVSEQRLKVVRLGINTDPLRTIPPPANDQTLRLAYIGQIAPHKGVHILVRALGLLPDAGRPITLTIHGGASDKSYERQLRALAQDDHRITFAGRFANDRVADVLAQTDVIVVPSIWYENSPLTILEAQAAGRPVLASAHGGMAELVNDGIDGLLFHPGNAADLARKIQQLRDDPDLLSRLHYATPCPPSIDEELYSLSLLYQQTIREAGQLHSPAA